MKKYKLLKDWVLYTHTIKGGAIVEMESNERDYFSSGMFEEIKEDPYWCEHDVNRISSVPCRLCPKPTEKEECKHENANRDVHYLHCPDCSASIFRLAQPKQLPSVGIAKLSHELLTAGHYRGAEASIQCDITAIKAFLDEHFKY